MSSEDALTLESDTMVLDPVASERQCRCDLYSKVEREVWRPGDGDGVQGTDYFDRQGEQLPIEKRWRLFQSDIGTIGVSKAKPPRHVMLDDLAVWEILKSDIPRSQLTRYWEHDFAGQGKTRVRRPHRGRPAIKDGAVGGDQKYHSVPFGAKNTLYYLTGEKGYNPVVYGELPAPQLTEEEMSRKRRAESPPDYNPRAHGHNQHTPKDMLVKHGAPTFSRKPKSEGLKLPRYVPKLPRGFVASKAPPAMKRKVGTGNTLPVERDEKRDGTAELKSTLANTSSPTTDDTSLPAEADDTEEILLEKVPEASDSDEEIPLGRPKEHQSNTPEPSATVNRLTQDVPRLMPYIERRAHEQKLAEEMTTRVENKQDVERIANELAEAIVRLLDQDQEIGRLNAALARANDEVAEANGKLAGLEAEISRLQQASEAHL